MLSSDHEESMLRYAHRPAGLADRRYKPHVEVAPNCPRCGSPNTKFCYYNNYSLSQPRYFCKGCRRYWTKGGSLRNVPVGGGCRKNRRGKSTRAVDDTAATRSVTFAQRLPGPVRPDLVLEVMAGRPASPGQPMSAGVPAPADRPTIDLALLYAKLLHHQADGSSGSLTEPLAGRHVSEAEALFDTFRVSSDMSPSVQVPSSTTMACTDGRALALGELNFCMDQSCYDSLGLPKGIENSIFSPSGSTVPSVSPWKADAKYGPFDSLPDDATSLHVGICSTGDGDWSSALDSQGLDALCRP